MLPLNLNIFLMLIKQSRKSMLIISIVLVLIGIIQYINQPITYESKAVISVPTIMGALVSSPEDLVDKFSSTHFLNQIYLEIDIEPESSDGKSIKDALFSATIIGRNKISIHLISAQENRSKSLLDRTLLAINTVQSKKSQAEIDLLNTTLNQNIEILNKIDWSINKTGREGFSYKDSSEINNSPNLLSTLLQERRQYSNDISAINKQINEFRMLKISVLQISDEIMKPSRLQSLLKIFMFAFFGMILGVLFTISKKAYGNL